jgi:hypothetical protein
MTKQPPTLVDCGCETKVHKDGSGVEIYFYPLHAAAPELLAALQEILAIHGLLGGDGAEWKRPIVLGQYVLKQARDAIAKAIGG